MRRRLAFLGVFLALAGLAVPALADAHPLGNFTINRYSRIDVSGSRVYVLYVLDMAEIPTFQARSSGGIDADVYAKRIARGVRLSIDGRPARLVPARHALAFPPGAGGLQTTRLEVVLAGPVLHGRSAVVSYHDNNYAGRIGWKEITARGDDGAAITGASAPAKSISEELRAYPKDLLQSPLDVSSARITVDPGAAPGEAPALTHGKTLQAPDRVADSGFSSLIGRGHLSALVILASLAAALFWGAAHALSPGHGKTIIAAYLVGQRGKVRHAAYLGLIVTATHTIGVFALGGVTLALSQFILPEQLYPWLNLVSGVLVVGIGASVFTGRLRRRLAHARAHAHGHDHDHLHHHDHDHGHAHSHQHGHDHVPREPGLRGLLAVGVSGGLLPCPSALVVLLAAISLHRVGFGLVLILAFSAGLALTITGIGLVAVLAKRAFSRLSLQGRVVGLLPAVSALVILIAGIAMTVRALPKVS
jgi:nickel/cobalt transporter (NicO) family protein